MEFFARLWRVQNDKKTVRHSDPEQSEGEESPSNGILCPAKVGFMMTNIRAGFMMTGCVLRRRWEVASDYRHLSYNVL